MGTVLLLIVGGICFAILVTALARRGPWPAVSRRAFPPRRTSPPFVSDSEDGIESPDMTDPESSSPRKRSTRRGAGTGQTSPGASGKQPFRRCPLCEALLSPGERIKSVVYSAGTDGSSAVYRTGSGGRMTEAMTHIFGCPHCYPSGRPRRCPVCNGELPREGYLVARMFSRAGKRKHVHVLGCTGCRRVR